MNQYDQNWQCRNVISCGAQHISDQSEQDGEFCQDCFDEKMEYEAYVARLVGENANLKKALTGMVNHESAANAREGLEPSMELQFAQEVLGLVQLGQGCQS